MGIHYFYAWFSRKYQEVIKKYKKYNQIQESIDILAFDLNSIIHNSAQKVFGYGNYNEPQCGHPTIFKIYKDITTELDKMVNMINPKEVLICIDGVAGLAKIFQQRQRRFKSSLSPLDEFDSTCISPGTRFLDGLSHYIITFLKTSSWNAKTIRFSSDRVAGEGEEKCFSHFRNFPNKKCLIYGSDADLIMYSLLSSNENIYILRDNHYNKNECFLVNMNEFISKHLKIPKSDFVFVCFLIGNDFLPSIPNIEVFDGGMEELFEIYQNIRGEFGDFINHKMEFNRKPIKEFFFELSKHEKTWLTKKMLSGDHYYDKNIDDSEGNLIVYRELYYKNKLKGASNVDVASEYLRGMQWVLKYYSFGIPDWSWYFPHQYSPFLSDLVAGISEQATMEFNNVSKPLSPFQQLLLILPPPSRELLPHPLNTLLEDDSPIKEYYPDEFEVDLSGKRRAWEGIPILPDIDVRRVLKEYNCRFNEISEKDKHRNRRGKVFMFEK